MTSDIELIGVDEKTIDLLYNNLDPNELLSLAVNYDKVRDNIEYLQSFGITCISDLLLYRSYLFLKEKEELTHALKKVNIPVFVNLVNSDYNIIDEIFV